MAAIPVAKVASLLVRTLAKPIATKLKKEAALHPLLSSASQFIGQRMHSVSSRINVTTAGFKFVGVKPLPKEEALSKGVNFISEFFIFSVAVSVVVIENFRSDYLSGIKKEKEAAEVKMKQDILERRFTRIEQTIQEIEESLPTSSTWHLQKLRKLKEEMIIEAEKKLEEEKEREKQELEEKLRDKMTKKSAKKPLPSTPRAARINKLKKVSVSVSDKNSEDPKSEPAPDNDSVSDSKNSVSVGLGEE